MENPFSTGRNFEQDYAHIGGADRERRRRANKTGGKTERGKEPTHTAYMQICQSWLVGVGVKGPRGQDTTVEIPG